MKKSFYVWIASIIFIVSCSKSNMEVPSGNYIKISESFAEGASAKVELYAVEQLSTGYNSVFIALYDSVTGQRLEHASITLVPMMNMGTMMHSCPVENPANVAVNKYFEGGIVFTMPTGSMGSWEVKIIVDHAGKTGMATIPVNVSAPATARIKSFISKHDNSKFFVALLQPSSPKIGVNDFELGIYKAKNMMEYPADSSLSVTLSPEMPTMGHGSPNNVDPVHSQKGRYKGKVNFTMTGLWHVNLDFKAGTAVADSSTFFEVNF